MGISPEENEVMEQFREGSEMYRRIAREMDGKGYGGMADEARRIAEQSDFVVMLMESGMFFEHPRSALLAGELTERAEDFNAAMTGLMGLN